MRKRIDMFYALSYSSVIGAAYRTVPGEQATTCGAADEALTRRSTSEQLNGGSDMDRMPCGYLDDPRMWDQDDTTDEVELMTDVEKRLEWICDDWRDALINDSYDEWRDMRMALYGAQQALNWCGVDRFEDRMALSYLSTIAFENSLQHIRKGG